MELPELKKEFLTIDEVAERWTIKTGRIISKDRVIAHGEDGSLRFHLVHDLSWIDPEDMYYSAGKIDENCEVVGNEPFSPFIIDEIKLRYLLQPRNWCFHVNELLSEDDGFKHSDLYQSRYMPISEHNLRVSLTEIERFESVSVQVENVEKLPEYIDPNSDYYAEELDIAIKAHIAVFKDKYGNPHQSNTDRITTWLIKNYPEKSQSDLFLKRIKTVVLPKK